MKLDKNHHSVFLLYYHLVIVVKYRRKVITDEISSFAKSIFIKIGLQYGVTLEEWNHDVDHVHIMFKARPDSQLSKFIGVFKSSSSRLIKQHFSVSRMLWKKMFWSRSFCLLSTGGAPILTIRRYIEDQGQTHAQNEKK